MRTRTTAGISSRLKLPIAAPDTQCVVLEAGLERLFLFPHQTGHISRIRTAFPLLTHHVGLLHTGCVTSLKPIGYSHVGGFP